MPRFDLAIWIFCLCDSQSLMASLLLCFRHPPYVRPHIARPRILVWPRESTIYDIMVGQRLKQLIESCLVRPCAGEYRNVAVLAALKVMDYRLVDVLKVGPRRTRHIGRRYGDRRRVVLTRSRKLPPRYLVDSGGDGWPINPVAADRLIMVADRRRTRWGDVPCTACETSTVSIDGLSIVASTSSEPMLLKNPGSRAGKRYVVSEDDLAGPVNMNPPYSASDRSASWSHA